MTRHYRSAQSYRNAYNSRLSTFQSAEARFNAPVYSVGAYLTAVAEVIRKRFDNVVSPERNEEFKANCASDAFQLVVANMDGEHDFEPQDYVTAALTVTFIANMQPRPGFQADLCAVVGAMDIPQHKMKLAMYAVKMYLESVAKASAAVDTSSSVHIGSIKQRMTLTVHVFQSDLTHSEWGDSYRTKAADANGNIVTWYAKEEIAKGDHSITGTVTKHNEYNGAKETYLNRVVVS